MNNVAELQTLVDRFRSNIAYYKDGKKSYNEHSCRIEYIDPLLVMLGWDVPNAKGLAPQYREVIAENYSMQTDRPDYSLTLRGVTRIFVEAKKPSVDISSVSEPALQARKYGWNAKHKVSILTNFEYLAIYDCTHIPDNEDNSSVARYRLYHFSEYIEKFDEICSLISKESIYSGSFDAFFGESFVGAGSQKQQVDNIFLSQINQWRISLSNELYTKHEKYYSLDTLNDCVQEFINQIVFLRICEDKNLPLYHKLQDTVKDESQLQVKLEELIRAADKRYNSRLFSGESIVFDLDNKVISDIIKGLYYPQSPYMFNIIEPNMLGKIYEMFLTEQLIVLDDGSIGLGKKKECANRSVVTTPTEIVRYMVEKTMYHLCEGKSPIELCGLKISDIACGSGIFLEEVFAYLQSYCVDWYIKNDKAHLIEIGNGRYKLPLDEKKHLLSSCIYGIDIDIHAVEVAKFSLLIKLIEDETAPSVVGEIPILPDLSSNIFHGNALISYEDLLGLTFSDDDLISLAPFGWGEMNVPDSFDAIIGNPPYVNTEGMHSLLPPVEFNAYKKQYISSHKQFDKYFVFLERAIQKVKAGGYICYIVPNKFFKIGAGEKLRQLIAEQKILVSLDDFGDAQLFEDKTIYSSIVLLQKSEQENFQYTNVDSANKLWSGEMLNSISLNSDTLNKLPWRLTTDFEFLSLLKKLDSVSVPLTKHAEIFNGIQTSAERPTPIYWFSFDEVVEETELTYRIQKGEFYYTIEKEILKPYFKPTRKAEKGLNSYSILKTDKLIIFPYDENGRLIPQHIMRTNFPGTYKYLIMHYDRLVPKCVSPSGIRDVPNATIDTWYQYGRTQALTAFINTPKLIVGVLSKEPMYAYDAQDMLIASGGTAGYCAVTEKDESEYALEYIQAWVSNPYTERILEIVGSDFEGGFVARGTFVLSTLPFVELDFGKATQKAIYDRVVEATREIYSINDKLNNHPSKATESVLLRTKSELVTEIEGLIARVYRLEF